MDVRPPRDDAPLTIVSRIFIINRLANIGAHVKNPTFLIANLVNSVNNEFSSTYWGQMTIFDFNYIP